MSDQITSCPSSCKDITGKSFGMLTVEGFVGFLNKITRWQCRCQCGTITIVYRSNLKCRSSCGCRNRELASKRLRKHGHSVGANRKTYAVWLDMRERCDPNNVHPHAKIYYSGRGITVCDRWSSFENFLEDMGVCPEGTSIDRIDNDGNYEPGNCRWATKKEQARNKRTNLLVTLNGETLCAAEWAERSGLKYGTIIRRIRAGWPAELILSPVRPMKVTAECP